MADELLPGPFHSPLGLAAFDSLRAEDEPWLADCYVPPTDFPLMAGAGSAVIFGEVGAGKTALRLALERAWCGPGAKARPLLVRWQFGALIANEGAPSGSPLAAKHQRQVFDAVARALLAHLGQEPSLWERTPAWAQKTLSWFVRTFFTGDLAIYLESLAEDKGVPDGTLTVLRTIVTSHSADLLSSDAAPVAVVDELARGLTYIGLSGVRILLEGLEPWWEAYPSRVTEGLRTFLSVLALFEHPAFVYTFLLPPGLWGELSRASGVQRRRVRMFHLRYLEPELLRIVERRLALALGRPDASLAEVGPAAQLRAWLAGCGGVSPRGWLDAFRPFLAAYLARSEPREPLNERDCFALQEAHPPMLWVEPATGSVTVGWRQITGLSKGQIGILGHLSEHAGEICSRKSLYRAYQLAMNEKYGEKEPPLEKEIEDTLNTALYRLREQIEPIPERPVLLETIRGRGVRLRFPARD